MYKPIANEIFHVHTWRCGHAGSEKDYEYIESAIQLGASRIVFTDHCPFPGNPFRSRMKIEQLPEYLDTLSRFKDRYKMDIEILIGLEAEYLPSFHEYYPELLKNDELDLLILGQHMYEHETGGWSFADEDKSQEYEGLCKAIVEGIKTDCFDVVAHPDRSFRRCKEWTDKMKQASNQIIEEAQKHNVLLEKNYSSMRHKNYFWNQFWTKVATEKSIHGYDAHSVSEMERIFNTKGGNENE